MKTPRSFTRALAELQLPTVFNPYSDYCPIHDRLNAAQIRRRNFTRCLEYAMDSQVETIWIARDLGYRGGRRTGIPLTDEVHLHSTEKLFGDIDLERATKGPVIGERTAAIIWRVLTRINQPVVLWNIFPLHPYCSSNPLTNRCHTRSERDLCWPLLEALLKMIQPKQIVAIGRDAANALSDIKYPLKNVRHPSYGGQTEFITSVYSLYGVSETTAVQ